MRRITFVLVVLLAAGAGLLAGFFIGQHSRAPGPTADPGGTNSGKQADLKWARQVAETFLQALVDGDLGTALDLGSPAFRERYGLSAAQDRDATYNAKMALCRSCGYNSQLAHKDDPARHDRFAIDKEEIAPGQDEAVFLGSLSGPKRTDPFRLVVTKDRQGDKWRVAVFGLDGR